ncbi:MAG: potassium channel family protein [Micromonosporaceae bacterium]
MVRRFLLRITNSPRAVVFGYIGLLVVSAVLYGRFEQRSVGDSIWWAVVTASTVGYGDTYPTHVAGRIVGAVLITVMVLVVIPLVTAHFASRLIVDSDAFKHEEQEEIKQNLRFIRAHLESQGAGLAAARAEEPAGTAER